jgi:hypothetical protein
VLRSVSARDCAVTRSPAAPASAQAPDASAFRRDIPILVMFIRLLLVLRFGYRFWYQPVGTRTIPTGWYANQDESLGTI